MAVHYKFNAAKEYDTLPVDGLHISLADLKEAIIHHKRLGRGDLCDLQVTNAETKETYTNDKALIPKNSSLIIARVPIDPSQRKFGDLSRDDKELLLSNPEYRMNTEGAEEAEQLSKKLEEVPDLTKLAGTEEEKISAMIAQSTLDYHPSRYLKLRNTVMSGKVPPFYKCYKCHQGGHWVTNCPLNNQDLRKSTGIPSKFLMEVDDPNTPGVMVTGIGKYVVFRQNLVMGEGTQAKVRPMWPEKPPDELVCLLCKEMMQDAVLTPCCANAYCDECIRNHLLDSDEHVCHSCQEKGIGPDTLVPNRYLRLKILQFGNQFLTELPAEESGKLESLAFKNVKSSSHSSTPVAPLSPVSPKEASVESPKVTVVESPKSPRGSPTVLEDVRILEEEEKSRKMKEEEERVEVEVEEGGSEEEGLNERLSEPLPPDSHEEEEEEEEGTEETEETSGSIVKPKKHVKKSKKKKDEGKERKHKKHKEKDKEKKKKGKRKGSKERDPTDDGPEKHVDSLMNEAICPTFDPSVPPPGTLPIAGVIAPGYPVSSVMAPHSHHYSHIPHHHSGMMPHASHYGIASQEEDPVTTFMRYLEKKDEQKRKRRRSKSTSRSPPYRDRSRPRHQQMSGAYSRSRSRSISKTGSPSWSRKTKGGGSPRSRRRYSPSPPSSSRHGYRSISRDRISPSLSRSPSPGRRFKSSPFSSGNMYQSSYSPHRMGMEKPRENNLYNINPVYGTDHHAYNPYAYNPNMVYDNAGSLPGYGGGRYPRERGPPRDVRRHPQHHRFGPYESGPELPLPHEDPFKEDLRRGDQRRMPNERRGYEGKRPFGRDEEWKGRGRSHEKEEWVKRSSLKGEHRGHPHEGRRGGSPSDVYRSSRREYESTKEDSVHGDGRGGHRREKRRGSAEGTSRKSRSPNSSPPPARDKEKRRERGYKTSQERATPVITKEEEKKKTGEGKSKEKARKERKLSENERGKSHEKEHKKSSRERVSRWGDEKEKTKVSESENPPREGRTLPPSLETETPLPEKDKKKHDKKKKKKEKRRASQASQEEGTGVTEGTVDDEKKAAKKREKERKKQKKAQEIEKNNEKNIEGVVDQYQPPMEVSEKESAASDEPSLAGETGVNEERELESAFLPALSKWEREDEEYSSPHKASIDPEEKEETNLVTSDVIKRAENALFSKGLVNRSLLPRKVYLEKSNRERERDQLQIQQHQNPEIQRSPTPEWERPDTREAKKKGVSIQITISSKTESQIGRPRYGFKGNTVEGSEHEMVVPPGPSEMERKPSLDPTSSLGPDTGKFRRSRDGGSRRGEIAAIHASSPKKRELSANSLGEVKTKKVKVDSESVRNSEKGTQNSIESTKFDDDCFNDSDTEKNMITDGKQEAVFMESQNDSHGDAKLPTSPERVMSQEQVVSSTEEIRITDSLKEKILQEEDSVSQSSPFSAYQPVIQSSPTHGPVSSMMQISESKEVRKKGNESDLEEGELIEDPHLETLPDSTEDQLDMSDQIKSLQLCSPDSGDKGVEPNLLESSSSVLPQNKVEENKGLIQMESGLQDAFMMSPPSPTIKRSTKEQILKEKKAKKKKKRKPSSSSSSSSSDSSDSSSDSSSEADGSKKKKKKKKRMKKKIAGDFAESSDDGANGVKKKKKKKDKKKKKKKEKRKEKKQRERDLEQLHLSQKIS